MELEITAATFVSVSVKVKGAFQFTVKDAECPANNNVGMLIEYSYSDRAGFLGHIQGCAIFLNGRVYDVFKPRGHDVYIRYERGDRHDSLGRLIENSILDKLKDYLANEV